MAIDSGTWLDLIEREYIRDFITGGGAAVKFAIGDHDALTRVRERLASISGRHGLLQVPIDTRTTKLHMIQDVFFAVARAVDFDDMAQSRVEEMFRRNRYDWPSPGQPVPIQTVADTNKVDLILLDRDFKKWLTADIMRDDRMAQDFRVAMTQLCRLRLQPDDRDSGVVEPILEWLRGDLRTVGSLKQLQINTKITRYNARAMLRSLCQWFRSCKKPGICLTLDIRQLGKDRGDIGDGLKYSPAAVMDAFEVLRQVIDDADQFEGLFVVVFADEAFLEGDSRRSVEAYTALKMRIWADVHARGRDNPLAPLVRLDGGSGASSSPRSEQVMSK